MPAESRPPDPKERAATDLIEPEVVSDGSGSEADAWSLLSLSLDAAALDAPARERLLSELRGPRRFAPFTRTVATTFELPLDYARHAFALFDDGSAWRPGVFAGSKVASLQGRNGANLMLARLAAGTQIPHHKHAGRELTFVLQGRLIEDGQRACTSGQVMDKAKDTEHALAVGAEGECLVVFAHWPPR